MKMDWENLPTIRDYTEMMDGDVEKFIKGNFSDYLDEGITDWKEFILNTVNSHIKNNIRPNHPGFPTIYISSRVNEPLYFKFHERGAPTP
jgi:hypothetical protein